MDYEALKNRQLGDFPVGDFWNLRNHIKLANTAVKPSIMKLSNCKPGNLTVGDFLIPEIRCNNRN